MTNFIYSTDPCEGCRYYPPSSFGGKPCSYCDPYDQLHNCRNPVETEDDE